VNQVCVTTYSFQPQRTAQNLSEPVLTKAALTASSPKMSLLFTTPVDEAIYAQPLYLPSVIIGGLPHNVIYLATENNTVYAMDADSSQAPLWTRHLDHTGTGALGRPVIENKDLRASCTNFLPNYKIGITGTPVIDLSQNVPGVANTITSGVMYLVAAFAIDGTTTTFAQTIYALDVTTGNILAQMDVAATATGHPTNFTFSKQWANQRAALLFQNGQVYAAWGSHCDTGSWSGWLMAFQMTNNSFGKGPAAVWTVEPEAVNNIRHGGIWQAGGGPAGDGTYIYAATGNGVFDLQPNPPAPTPYAPCTVSSSAYLYCDYSNSVVKLSNPTGTSLKVADFFTAGDQANRTTLDYDLGSSAPMVVNTGGSPQNVVIQTGKGGDIYVLNADGASTMGGYSGDAGHFTGGTCSMDADDPMPDQITAAVYGRSNKGCGVCAGLLGGGECGPFSSSAWWGAGASGTPGLSYVYVAPVNGTIRQYTLCPGGSAALGCPNQATLTPNHASSKTFMYPSATPLVTSASCTSTDGLLWAVDNSGYGKTPPNPSVLYAYDATTMAAIWNSSKITGTVGATKFVPPVVVNGKAYLAGYLGMDVFGLK
jgi:hypothetical protein